MFRHGKILSKGLFLFTSSTKLTLYMQIGVPNYKIHKNIKFTRLLFRLHESMNKNFNSYKATTLFKN